MNNVRLARDSDIERIVEVCNIAWKGVWFGDSQMFKSRLDTFPQGLIVGEVDEKIEAYLSFQLVTGNENPSTWEEATDSGYLSKTHINTGKVIYGVGLASTDHGSKNGIVGELMNYVLGYAVKNCIEKAIFYCMLSDYSVYKNQVDIEKYIELVDKSGKPVDRQLSIMTKYGFGVTRPVKIIRNYLVNGGYESSEFSVLVERYNPYYKR